MSIGASFVTFVEADAGIAAVSSPSPLIFPHTLPQNHADPAMTYSVDDETDDYALDRVSGLSEATIDTSCWSTSVITARALADALYDALVPESAGVRYGYQGVLGDYTSDHIRRERRFELFETDTKLYRISQQFLIAYF